jgi:Bacterial Ig domain
LQNGGGITIPVLANDSDVEGSPLTVVGVTQPAGGTVTFTASAVIYTPAMNFSGTSIFSYTVSDGSGASAVAAVTVTMEGSAADYGFIGLQSPWTVTPLYGAKIGSSIPLVWQYASSGIVANSSLAMPEVRIRGPFACNAAETASTIELVAYPGNSGFQYFPSTSKWQFNWQTTGLAAGCYNVRVFSQQTRQVNGPFLIRLSK